MSDMNVSMVVTADNRQFLNSFSRSEAKIKSFGKQISGTFSRARKEIGRFGDKIGGLTTLLGGFSIVAAGKQIIDFDTRLARLAIQAGLTKKEMFMLKDQLFEIGGLTHQDPGKLLEGVEQIVEKTGNFEFAVKSLKDMGIVASATGSEMRGVGATTSDLQEKFRLTADEILPMFDILNKQGKEGSFTLSDMAAYFSELLPAAKDFGVHGIEGLRKFGAFLQIARRGIGSSAETKTAVVNAFADITDKWKTVRKLTGFNIFDKVKSDKEGRRVLRDMDVILKEIIKRTKGDVTKLQEIFGRDAIKAIRPMVDSYRQFGDFREFDRFVEMGGDGATIMKDFAFWSKQTAAKLQDLRIALSKFANENLAKPIELFTDALNVLNGHPALTEGGLYTLLGLLGVGAGIKIGRGVGGLFSSLRYILTGRGGPGAKGVGGLGGGLLGGKGPIPVYVVNKHLSMLPSEWGGGSPMSGGGASPKTGGIKLFGKKIKGLFTRGAGGLLGAGPGLQALKTGLTVGEAGFGTTALAGTAAFAGGYGIGTLLNKGFGWLSEKISGGKYGGEGWLGDILYDILHSEKKSGSPEVKVEVKNNIRIDEHDHTFTETDNMNARIDTKLQRGNFFK